MLPLSSGLGEWDPVERRKSPTPQNNLTTSGSASPSASRMWGKATAAIVDAEVKPEPVQPPHQELEAEPSEEVKKSYSNSKSLLARFANKMRTIGKEFTQQQELLREDLPKLLAWEERAEAFLRLLRQLKQEKRERTPEILVEREELHKLLQKSKCTLSILEGYVQNDLTQWVRPLNRSDDIAETSFRVQFAVTLKAMLEERADNFFQDLLKSRPQFERLASKYQELERKLKDIDTTIASLDEIVPDYLTFKDQVAKAKTKVVPIDLQNPVDPLNKSATLANEMMRIFAKANEAWEKSSTILGMMRTDIDKLSRWLYHPDMPQDSAAAAKNQRDKLLLLLKDYSDKLLHGPAIYLEGTLSNLNSALKEFRTLLEPERLKAFSPLPVTVEVWAKEAGESAIKRLENRLWEVNQTASIYKALKDQATAKSELISSDLQNHQPVLAAELVPSKHLLRNTVFPLLTAAQNAKVSSGGIWYYLSLPFSYFYSSQQLTEEIPLDPDDASNQAVWTTAISADSKKMLDAFMLTYAKYQSILPKNYEQLDIQGHPKDYWTYANYWAFALNLINIKGYGCLSNLNQSAAQVAQIDICHRLLVDIAKKWKDEKFAKELGFQKHYWIDLYTQLLEECNGVNYERMQAEVGTDTLLSNLNLCLVNMLTAYKDTIKDSAESIACWESMEHIKQLIAYIGERRSYAQKIDEISKSLRKETTFGQPTRVIAKVPVPNGWLPVKPSTLQARLNYSLTDPAKLLETVETQLASLEQDVTSHEAEKLKYHEEKFAIQGFHVDKLLKQCSKLVSNIQFLDQFAATIAAFYQSTPTVLPPLLDKERKQLKFLLESLTTNHALIAGDIRAFHPMVLRAKELLTKLVERESLKQTAEKIKWRAEQAEIGLRKHSSNEKRLQQLEQAEARYRVALHQLEELWKMAQAFYLPVHQKIEGLNLKLNGEWQSYWSGYVAEPIIVNPFTATEPVAVAAPPPAAPLAPPAGKNQPAPAPAAPQASAPVAVPNGPNAGGEGLESTSVDNLIKDLNDLVKANDKNK